MTDGSQFVDIIFFAMVAIFLGLRLRSVLGRRTGHEKPPPNATPAPPNGDRVVELRPRAAPDIPEVEPRDMPASTGLTQIRIADPGFDPDTFLAGAKMAFEMVVKSFAAGDEATLKPLLSEEVFHNFAQAIARRRAAGEICETELVRINAAEIAEARMDGHTARVAVRFASLQVIVVKDAEGRIVEGDPSRSVQLTDLWSFARDTRSRDPNWLLVATTSQEE